MTPHDDEHETTCVLTFALMVVLLLLVLGATLVYEIVDAILSWPPSK